MQPAARGFVNTAEIDATNARRHMPANLPRETDPSNRPVEPQ